MLWHLRIPPRLSIYALSTQSFMYVTIAIAVFFAAFVAWRMLRAPAVPQDETGSFAPMTAQAPAAAELALPQEDGKG